MVQLSFWSLWKTGCAVAQAVSSLRCWGWLWTSDPLSLSSKCSHYRCAPSLAANGVDGHSGEQELDSLPWIIPKRKNGTGQQQQQQQSPTPTTPHNPSHRTPQQAYHTIPTTTHQPSHHTTLTTVLHHATHTTSPTPHKPYHTNDTTVTIVTTSHTDRTHVSRYPQPRCTDLDLLLHC